MEFHHFKGLNCYFNSAITIGHYWGMDYNKAFYNLLTESDFSHFGQNGMYTSKRVINNLNAMGLYIETICPAQWSKALTGLLKNEGFIIAGMDAFDISWSPIYNVLHDPHYFIAGYNGKNTFICYDPTYDKKGMIIDDASILNNAFDIAIVEKRAADSFEPNIYEEAKAILSGHSIIKKMFFNKLMAFASLSKDEKLFLGKYVEAFKNNRLLFKRFLQNSGLNAGSGCFNDDYFNKWEGAKNGLYKAYVLQDNKKTLKEVYDILLYLLCIEESFAKGLAGEALEG